MAKECKYYCEDCGDCLECYGELECLRGGDHTLQLKRKIEEEQKEKDNEQETSERETRVPQ
jgi:hypothetical protein